MVSAIKNEWEALKAYQQEAQQVQQVQQPQYSVKIPAALLRGFVKKAPKEARRNSRGCSDGMLKKRRSEGEILAFDQGTAMDISQPHQLRGDVSDQQGTLKRAGRKQIQHLQDTASMGTLRCTCSALFDGVV